MRPLMQRALAETLGTLTLVLFGATAVYMGSFPGGGWGTLGVALAHAILLAVAVSATMGISGGHLNPAVTLGLLAIRRVSPRDAGVYLVAQLVGGALAGGIASTLFAPHVGQITAFGAPMLGVGIGVGKGIAVEAVLTFFLMSAVMGTAVLRSAPPIGGFGIGLILLPLIMVGAPLTGAALNPARAFGPALAAGMFTHQIVYWVGPILGAVAAALIWQRLESPDR